MKVKLLRKILLPFLNNLEINEGTTLEVEDDKGSYYFCEYDNHNFWIEKYLCQKLDN